MIGLYLHVSIYPLVAKTGLLLGMGCCKDGAAVSRQRHIGSNRGSRALPLMGAERMQHLVRASRNELSRTNSRNRFCFGMRSFSQLESSDRSWKDSRLQDCTTKDASVRGLEQHENAQPSLTEACKAANLMPTPTKQTTADSFFPEAESARGYWLKPGSSCGEHPVCRWHCTPRSSHDPAKATQAATKEHLLAILPAAVKVRKKGKIETCNMISRF